MQKLKINDGSSRVAIENEHGTELGVIEFFPSDVNLPKRLDVGWKHIKEYLDNVQPELEKAGNDIDSISDIMSETDAKIKEQMDYIFDTNISGIFGNTNFVTPTRSGFLIENIMNGLIPFIEREIKEAFKNTEQHIGKYTQRYHN